jgi:hypothetical protein
VSLVASVAFSRTQMRVTPRHGQALVPEKIRNVFERRPFHPQPAGKGVPQVMAMKVLEFSFSDCIIKPMLPFSSGSPVLPDRKIRPRPSPRSKTVFKAAKAASFRGSCTASSFFIREMLSIRYFQSTMSQVRPYWLPSRKPVSIARSSSGTCKGHLAWTIFRSFFPLLRSGIARGYCLRGDEPPSARDLY